MPPPAGVRSVEDVTATSSTPIVRRELSPTAALLLTIGGHVLAVGIAAIGVAGVAVAAIAVFGPQVLAAL